MRRMGAIHMYSGVIARAGLASLLIAVTGCGVAGIAEPDSSGDVSVGVSPGLAGSPSGPSRPDGPGGPSGAAVERGSVNAQLTRLSQSWSRPLPPGSRIEVTRPKQIPEVVAEGGIIVSAYISRKGVAPSGRSRFVPAGAPGSQVRSVVDEYSAIPGAVVDWSLSAQPDSVPPEDPGFNPDPTPYPAIPNQQVPFSRIGLCCSPPGITDGWDLVSERTRNRPAFGGSLSNVNIAIIDTGLLENDGDVKSDIGGDDRFIGGWDFANAKPDYSYEAGQDWEESAKGEYLTEGHGTGVAALAVAVADNAAGIAGAAGALPSVKYGMFRYKAYSVSGTNYPIMGGVANALGVVDRQLRDYQQDPGTGYKWNIVNMSLGGVASDRVSSLLLEELAAKGVLVIESAGNERDGYSEHNEKGKVRKEIQYGMNPVSFPASDPNVVAVAAWGSKPAEGPKSDPTQWDYTKMYKDETSEFSSAYPFVDLTAPGAALPLLDEVGGVYANNGSNGTSWAAPIVSGIAATLISLSGNQFQCPNKKTVAERRSCVEELRAVLIGATNDIANPAENPSTQGAGIIDAPAAYLKAPYLKVPARPRNLAIQIKNFESFTGDFEGTLDWKSADTWANGSNRGIAETGFEVTYRLYADGDPTRQVSKDELDPNRPVEAGAESDQKTGKWTVPGAWDQYRIPYQPIKPISGKGNTTISGTTPISGTTGGRASLMFSITEVHTYKDSNGKPRRQVESLPVTLTCGPKGGVFSAANCQIYTGE